MGKSSYMKKGHRMLPPGTWEDREERFLSCLTTREREQRERPTYNEMSAETGLAPGILIATTERLLVKGFIHVPLTRQRRNVRITPAGRTWLLHRAERALVG